MQDRIVRRKCAQKVPARFPTKKESNCEKEHRRPLAWFLLACTSPEEQAGSSANTRRETSSKLQRLKNSEEIEETARSESPENGSWERFRNKRLHE
jgi:hypothetical protein